MSSFICSAKHFNSIENKLIEIVSYGDCKGKFEIKEINKFVSNLRELNVLCVSFQYASHYEGKLDIEIKEQKEIVNMKDRAKYLTNLGLYNALICVNYQLETEHIEGIFDALISDTMPMLEKIMNFVAKLIVYSLPEDKTNTWEVK